MKYVLLIMILVILFVLWYNNNTIIDPAIIHPATVGYSNNVVGTILDPSKISPVFMGDW